MTATQWERQNQVGARILEALEDAARNSKWLDHIKIYVEHCIFGEPHGAGRYEISVKYQIISGTRQYPKFTFIYIIVCLEENPAITFQLRVGDVKNEFRYFAINEPELKMLIEMASFDTANWHPSGIEEVR